MLKEGYSFREGWVLPPNKDLEESTTSTSSVPKDVESGEQHSQKPAVTNVDVDNLLLGSTTEVTKALGKRKYKDTVHAANTETKEEGVASKIREIVATEGHLKYGSLRTLLNFDSYNVEFLVKLSHVLHIDISDAMNVRRPTREGIINALINKL